VRPPRELAWALAMYVYSLTPPPHAVTNDDERVAAGEKLFQDSCAGCHHNAALGGDPVPVRRVGTDEALALGKGRGTGNYRPPALIDLVHAAPYLHQGAVPTLDDLLSPARLSPDYTGSPVGPGPVLGHAFGTRMSSEERENLVAYLRTL